MKKENIFGTIIIVFVAAVNVVRSKHIWSNLDLRVEHKIENKSLFDIKTVVGNQNKQKSESEKAILANLFPFSERLKKVKNTSTKKNQIFSKNSNLKEK